MPEQTTGPPDLSDRNYIVTGASRGLGAFIARKLRQCGANLLLVSKSAERLEERRSELHVSACVADLADPSAPNSIFEAARSVWTRLDGLVNNAGIQGPIGPFGETDWNEWTRAIQVDLLAPAALCRLAIPWMRATGGSIVNLSGGGATAPRPNFTAYSTAKAALVRFSETLAREEEPFGIRVNCIAPGAMNTDMLRDVIAAGEHRVGSAEYERALQRDKEVGDPPEQAADLVAFLLSDLSAGITGRLISAVWDPWRTLPERLAELRDPDLYTLRRVSPASGRKGCR